MKKWYYIFYCLLTLFACEVKEDPPQIDDGPEDPELLILEAIHQEICSGNSTYIRIVNRTDLYGSLVNWEIEPKVGSIADGVYKAPEHLDRNVEITVSASLSADTKVKGTVKINLLTSDNGISVRLLEDLKFQPNDVVFSGDGGIIASSAKFAIILNPKAPPTQIGDPDFLVSRIGPDGVLLWQKSFGRGNSEKIALFDNDIYALGYLENFKMFLVKLDQNGNVLGQLELEEGFSPTLEVDPMGHILVGFTTFPNNTLGRNLMIKLNSQMETLWEIDLGQKVISGIKATQQGNIFYAFDTFDANPFSGIGYLEETGSKIWEEELKQGTWELKRIIKSEPSNELVAVFRAYNFGDAFSKEQVLIINTDGTKNELMTFEHTLGFTSTRDVFVNENQELYFISNFESSRDVNHTRYYNFRIAKADRFGNILQNWDYVKMKNPFGSIYYNLLGKALNQEADRISFFVYSERMFLINTNLNFEIDECQRRGIY